MRCDERVTAQDASETEHLHVPRVPSPAGTTRPSYGTTPARARPRLAVRLRIASTSRASRRSSALGGVWACTGRGTGGRLGRLHTQRPRGCRARGGSAVSLRWDHHPEGKSRRKSTAPSESPLRVTKSEVEHTAPPEGTTERRRAAGEDVGGRRQREPAPAPGGGLKVEAPPLQRHSARPPSETPDPIGSRRKSLRARRALPVRRERRAAPVPAGPTGSAGRPGRRG
jgi:hypothetical protein